MIVKTSCTRDCPDACGLLAEVEEGRVVGLRGDPDHPVTRGFLCYRTNRFLERQHDPDRLTKPLVRVDGDLRETSWDDALDRVAAKLLQVREESGPEAIFHYRSGGSLGLMKHVTDLFFERFGPCAMKSGDICSGAGDVAQETDFGEEDSHDLFDIRHSKTILLWGKNPHVSHIHLVPLLKEARQRGTRIVLIDPVHHRGTELADLYLQPRPGGDLALAAGVMAWLIGEGRTDTNVAEYCDHVDDLVASVTERSVPAWAELAGVTAEELVELASAYADGPSALFVGWGMQRRANGSATVRMMDALGALSGNIGVPGGGVSFYFKRRGAFDLSFQRGLDVAPRSIPEPLLGPGLLAAKDPEVRVLWVTAGNPVAMLPESGTVVEALRSREMTIVVDSHRTDSTDCADVVLPTVTMLEDDDLVGAYGHHWIGNVQPAVPALGEAKTDYEIVRALAPRVGLGDVFDRDAASWKERLLSRVAPRGASLIALENGAVRNPESAEVLFADRRFPTESGKMNLIQNFDPAPTPTTAERPLLLMALSTAKFQASQATRAQQEGRAVCTVHPEAAAGFAEGDIARLESAVTEIEVVLEFDARQRRDVALMAKGGWWSKGRSANALVRASTTDAGGGACYYDEPVRLLPVGNG